MGIREELTMKKLSIVLAIIIAMTSVSLCFNASAYEMNCPKPASQPSKENKSLTYLYEYDTKTLYVNGKGAIPANYMGWSQELNTDINDFLADSEASYEIHEKNTNQYFENDYSKNVLPKKDILPDYYFDITRHVKKLVIGEGITEIGNNAFSYSFPNLEKLSLPSSMKRINGSIISASIVKTLIIPKNVTYVDDTAFFGSKIENLVFEGAKSKINLNYYKDIPLNKNWPSCEAGAPKSTVYAPKGSVTESQLKSHSNFVAVSKPAKVKGLKATATKTTLKLTWSKSKGATKYQVQKYIASQNKWKTCATVSNNSYTLKSLKSKKQYKVRVRAIKNVKGGKFYGAYSDTLVKKTK